MSIHIWRKKEEELADLCVVVVELKIESLTEFDTTKRDHKYAEGEITLKDYIEHGIVFTDPWMAWGMLQEDGILDWLVQRRKIESISFMNKTTGEAEFTANRRINRAVRIFIAQKINEYLKHRLAIVGPERYTGPREVYQGPCLCIWLEASNKQNPFPWQEETKGCFPQNCFQCSCGRRWWRYCSEHESWAEVADPQAWEMLFTYNGIDVRSLGCHEGKFFLAQTLADKGLIPIPTP